MNLPSIDISQTNAQIGMSSSRPFLKIKQPPAELSIRQEHADLVQISRRASKLYIDQTEAFADANLKGPLRRGKEFSDRSLQKLLANLAKSAQEGERLMKIEDGAGKIAQLAKENGKLEQKQTQLGWVPSSAFQVKFDYDPGDIEFNVKRSEPEINVNTNEPIIQFQKWQNDVYLKQKQSISFQAVGGNVNQQL